jgi:RNA polymerase sigma-70 factor (ECF subfamily)
MMGKISIMNTATPAWSDEEISLVVKAQRDPSQFTAIYQRYLNPIYSYLLAQVQDVREAEDLTAQVFLQALEDLPRYRPIRPFSAWLYSIARHRAADHFRRHPETPLEDDLNLPANSPDPLAEVLQNERWLHLQSALRGLTEEERELLRLRFAAGLSFAEIAELLGRKESAVKMALYRLLPRLESKMEEKYD